jgi:hypothetical protein
MTSVRNDGSRGGDAATLPESEQGYERHERENSEHPFFAANPKGAMVEMRSQLPTTPI